MFTLILKSRVREIFHLARVGEFGDLDTLFEIRKNIEKFFRFCETNIWVLIDWEIWIWEIDLGFLPHFQFCDSKYLVKNLKI